MAINYQPVNLSTARDTIEVAPYLPFDTQELAGLPLRCFLFASKKRFCLRCKGQFLSCAGGAGKRDVSIGC